MIVVVGFAIFRIPYSIGGASIVPVIYKIFPLPGDKPVSGKRWATAAVLLFVVLAIEDFVRFSYFDRFPHLKRLAGVAYREGFWLDVVLIGCLVVALILRKIKFAKDATRQ
jgi:hypothetical protein